MFKKSLWVPALVAVMGLGATITMAEKEVSMEGVKCLMVAKKDANAEKASKWKDGKVYFCCDGCLGKFEKLDEKGKEKLAAKANHQLVATKQYKQEVCPMSGGKLNDSTAIEVAGVKVAFCCNNCKGKAEKMEGDEQVAALFGEEAFKKAKYAPVKHDAK